MRAEQLPDPAPITPLQTPEIIRQQSLALAAHARIEGAQPLERLHSVLAFKAAVSSEFGGGGQNAHPI